MGSKLLNLENIARRETSGISGWSVPRELPYRKGGTMRIPVQIIDMEYLF
jgi:hypothetical protein